jgi:hypothetical protein
MFKITGFEKVQKELQEMQRAAQALDGEIAQISFNPDDPESVERAVHEMEQAVDAKAASYSHNAMVKAFIPEAKKAFEKRIRDAKKD